MYLPKAFQPRDANFSRQLIELEGLGTLISTDVDEGRLTITHLPFLCIDAAERPAGFDMISHFAKDNEHWRSLREDREVCVVFRGPHAYVSPQWYASPVNAPTWNYLTSHVFGFPRLIFDRDELLILMQRLVGHFEAKYAKPNGINLQPERLERLLGRIVGLCLRVTRLEEKAQLNQNRSHADQRSVAQVLAESADPGTRLISEIMISNVLSEEQASARAGTGDPGKAP